MRSKVNNINFLENKRNPSESKKLIQVYGFKTAIENAEHITVIGRKHRKGMIGTVYFGRKDSALTVMQKFRRSNDYCTS